MLSRVHQWVAEAGEIALRSYQVVEVRHKPDHSPVTVADEQIETLLRARIEAAYPDHSILGEEQGATLRPSPYVWAIDPIDGTGNFVHGVPIWGISVGLLKDGIPVLGCFYMPLLNEWYEADLDGPALFNGQPVLAATTDLDDSESWMCAPSNVHRRYSVTYPGKVRVLGSIAAAIAYVARGTATGALVGRASIWDMAGTLAVLHRAGGQAHYLGSTEPVDLMPLLQAHTSSQPILVGSPPALALLQAAVRRR